MCLFFGVLLFFDFFWSFFLRGVELRVLVIFGVHDAFCRFLFLYLLFYFLGCELDWDDRIRLMTLRSDDTPVNFLHPAAALGCLNMLRTAGAPELRVVINNLMDGVGRERITDV